jgi:hypothetical protein
MNNKLHERKLKIMRVENEGGNVNVASLSEDNITKSLSRRVAL